MQQNCGNFDYAEAAHISAALLSSQPTWQEGNSAASSAAAKPPKGRRRSVGCAYDLPTSSPLPMPMANFPPSRSRRGSLEPTFPSTRSRRGSRVAVASDNRQGGGERSERSFTSRRDDAAAASLPLSNKLDALSNQMSEVLKVAQDAKKRSVHVEEEMRAIHEEVRELQALMPDEVRDNVRGHGHDSNSGLDPIDFASGGNNGRGLGDADSDLFARSGRTLAEGLRVLLGGSEKIQWAPVVPHQVPMVPVVSPVQRKELP